MPSTLSLIRNMFTDPRQRTVAIGIWVSGFSVGSAIGPLVGGFLLEHFWWGSVFLLGVPVMVVLLIAGPILLPEYKDPHPGKFDLLSAGMSLAAVLLMIYGLKQIAQAGVGEVPLISIAAGLIVGVLFVQRQTTLADPLLDLRLFQKRAFSTALITYTLGVFAAFGTFLFIAQYLQLVLGLSPLEAGIWSVPGALASIVGSNIAPVLVRRTRVVNVVSGGLALTAIGIGLLTQTHLNSLELVVIGNVIMSLGFGLTFTLTADLVVGTAPPERAGAASAISETGAEFGGALGIAVLGSIGMAVYRTHVAAAALPDVPPEALIAAQETLGGAVTAAAELSGTAGTALLGTAREAFVLGLHLVAGIGMIGFAVLAVLTAILLRHVELHPGEADDEESEDEYPVEPVISRLPEAQMGD